jgi:fructose-1,6-bisphosphatase
VEFKKENFMGVQHTTLAAFLSTTTYGLAGDASLADLLLNIAEATKSIARLTEKGALTDMVSKLESKNIQGETQMQLDVESNQIFIDYLTRSGLVAGLASEEMDDPICIADKASKDKYLVVFDPLDGSSVRISISLFLTHWTAHPM